MSMPLPFHTVPPPSGQPLRLRPATRVTVFGGALLAVLFALGAMEYATALAGGRTPLLVMALAWLVSGDFAYNERATTVYMLPHYTAALKRMSQHMALGGLALGLGVLQLVPALRRRHPRLHRTSGLLVWLATAASMVGAIGFLSFIPMRQGASGPVFHLGLWALALLTLGLLSQAVLAVRARDYRSHMVWMALVFACLATAPMLRVDWTVGGWLTGANQETVNLATGAMVLLQTLFIMAIWLARVGDADLPARPAVAGPDVVAAARWPGRLLLGLCVFSALVLVHEVLAALLSIDAWARWRSDVADRLPLPGVLLWAMGSLAVFLRWPQAWADALAGRAPARWLTVAGAVAALGTLVMGLTHSHGSMARIGSATFWVAYGVLALTLLVLANVARPTRGGRNAWALFWLCLLWLPSQLPGFVALGLVLGLRFDESMLMALVNGVGGIAVAGLVIGYGAQLHGFRGRVSEFPPP